MAILLAFTSTCRQQKCYVMHYMKFTVIHHNFMNTSNISPILCSYMPTIYMLPLIPSIHYVAMYVAILEN